MFAGIGAFSVAFERCGVDTAWHVDIDKDCQTLLRSKWPDSLILGDVRECGAHNLPPVDIITFGSPCQGLSVAGKRAGFADLEVSGLFHQATRIIKEMREATGGRFPKFAIWENVPGAQSSANGRDFGAALDGLAESGAVDIAWRVIDAQHWVPQRRRRVFVVAVYPPIADGRAGIGRASEILALSEGVRRDTPARRETGKDVAGTLGGGTGSRGWASDTERMTFVASVAPTLTGALNRTVDTAESLISYGLNGKQGKRYDGESETFIPYSVRTAQTGSNGWGVQEHQAYTLDGAQQAVAYGIPGTGVGFALRANASHSGDKGDGGIETTVALTATAVRRLTPTECERLMGHADGYTAGFADSVRYRMLGNSIVVPVAEWIARRMTR